MTRHDTAPPRTAPHRRSRRERSEAGAAHTTVIVLLFPLTAIMLFAGVQTVLWQHARTIAADRANQVAAAVAAAELTPTEGRTRLTDTLRAERDLRPLTVTVTRDERLVTVTVIVDAPGILLGTRTRVSVHAAAPTEGWQPLP